uniref:7TM GPCR serpentine receptor class x (Srx) domain-containing protein n=1 Tax=Acrobeloides nanus TaxID=290746 RepID=A0A914EAY3_9BILA
MNFHIGQCLQASFLAGSLFQIIIAINRVLVFRHWKNVDRKVYNMIGSGVLALGFGLSYIQAFYFVCCPTYNHFQWFGPFRYNWVIEMDEKLFFLWIEATMNAVINATNKENRKVLLKLMSYKSMPVNAASEYNK